MSDIDRENYKQERKNQKTPLNPTTNNVSHDVQDTSGQQAASSKKKKIIYGAIGLVVLICIILAIVIPLTLKDKDKPGPGPGPGPGPNPTDAPLPYDNQEYNPYVIDESVTQTTVFKAQFVIRDPNYDKKQTTKKSSESRSLFSRLEATGSDYTPVNPSDIPIKQENNNGTDAIQLNIDMVNNYNLRILAQDKNNIDVDGSNYNHQVDSTIFQRPVFEHEARLTQVNFTNENSPFSFSFANIYSNNQILSTKNRKLFVSEKFSEIGFVLPSRRCYGLGQRNGQFLLSPGAYDLHAQGRDGSLPQDNQLGGNGGNHIHPFVLCQTQDKDFMGMFFVGTAPQHFEILVFNDDDRQVLNYITIGGPLEIYVMMRSSAQEIIQRYHAMIGNSAMPPYYALGAFQSSSSYDTLDKVNKVYAQYDSLQIALEGAIVTNYNQKPHQIFTINSQNFNNFAQSIAAIQAKKQKIVLGTSFGIAGDYDIFKTSIKYLCLVDSFVYENGQVIGVLDDTEVYYIDPFHDGTQGFFQETLQNFFTQTNFDGIYVQDNHLPNQIDGEIVQDLPPNSKPHPRKLSASSEEDYGNFKPWKINKDQSKYSTVNLPFLPNSQDLNHLSMSLNGSEGGNVTTLKIANLFVHNSNAHRSLQKVKGALLHNANTQKVRPFVLSESSWAGSGAYGVGVVTNLYRSWADLQNLIGQGIGLSMSGLGALMTDTCGSVGPMDEELCARWAQTAAFFPLVRNHYNVSYKNSDGQWVPTPGSEPYNMQSFTWQYTYTSALSNRIQYTRYIYSQLYSAYRIGGAVMRPLFFDAPTDDEAFNHVQDTYMLGDSIKVSPILNKGVNDGDSYTSYFTTGVWYDLNDYTKKITVQNGGMQQLTASNSYTNIHLKGGKIIPFIRNDKGYKVTRDLETGVKTSFIIGRDQSKNYADGNVYIDDGISAESITFDPSNEKYTFWKLRYAEKSINFWVDFGNFNYVPPTDYKIHLLREVMILDADDLADTQKACYMGTDLVPRLLNVDYNKFNKVLTIKPINDADLSFKDISIIRFVGQDDPDVCSSTTYSYKTDNKDITNTHKWTYSISNLGSPTIIKPLVVTFTQLDDIGTINVDITTQDDYNSGGKIIYKVPTPEVYDLSKFDTSNLQKPLSSYVKITENPFSYALYKDSSDQNTLIWRSNPTQLFFSDYFVMDAGIFKMNQNIDQPLLGMGERAGSIFYKNEKNGIHSRYTFDQANPIDDGLPPGRNMYGYQPFYAFQSAIQGTNDWVGVFDVNSYATDYIINSDNGNQETQIQKINIGGTINKFFFIGTKPDDVIKTYSKLVGYQTLPPVWAFGWHQCRFGYVTDEDWIEVYHNYTDQGFPIDAMWADIDYMDDYKLFTISPMSYPNITKYIQEVHDDQRYFVPIQDAGVAVRKNQGYKALDDGLASDVFIKQANKKDYLTAGVWCGNAYFPDFFKPETVDWWKKSFDYLNTELKFTMDGIWLDENEATNFCNGYCITSERPADSLRNKPFYVPGWRDLEDKALGVDGWHDSIGRYEYDVHNLYSLMQTKATAEYLIEMKKLRPYILTRANYPGIGKYSHHWMGDNWSTVEYMMLSVDGVMSYNLFALPFMGSDICGFNGDATDDICTRWHILGSLYPFARNHNQNASQSQEPYRFTNKTGNGDETYSDVIKRALITRYNFIKYYYSSFYDISVQGGSFFKPLFYEYPLDKRSYDEVEINILLGNSLKLSIETTNLDYVKNPAVTRNFYFPQANWCRVYPALTDATKDCFASLGGDQGNQTFATGLEDYYIHLRGGYIIPFQDATKLGVLKTKDLEKSSTDLYALHDSKNTAQGSIFFDDGVSVVDNTNSAEFTFQLTQNGDKSYTMAFTQQGTWAGQGKTHEQIGDIRFYWATNSGIKGLKNGVVTLKDKTTQTVALAYDAKTDISTLTLNNPKITFFGVTKIDLTA